jgi:hypothetical protein
VTIPVSCRSVNRDDALITRFMTGSSPYSPYRTPEGCRGRIPGVPGSTEAEVPRYVPVETSHPQRKSGFPKPPVPRPFPCGTPLSPSPPVLRRMSNIRSGARYGAPPGSGAHGQSVAWRGRRQVALGALRLQGARAKCRLFFLSARVGTKAGTGCAPGGRGRPGGGSRAGPHPHHHQRREEDRGRRTDAGCWHPRACGAGRVMTLRRGQQRPREGLSDTLDSLSAAPSRACCRSCGSSRRRPEGCYRKRRDKIAFENPIRRRFGARRHW